MRTWEMCSWTQIRWHGAARLPVTGFYYPLHEGQPVPCTHVLPWSCPQINNKQAQDCANLASLPKDGPPFATHSSGTTQPCSGSTVNVQARNQQIKDAADSRGDVPQCHFLLHLPSMSNWSTSPRHTSTLALHCLRLLLQSLGPLAITGAHAEELNRLPISPALQLCLNCTSASRCCGAQAVIDLALEFGVALATFQPLFWSCWQRFRVLQWAKVHLDSFTSASGSLGPSVLHDRVLRWQADCGQDPRGRQSRVHRRGEPWHPWLLHAARRAHKAAYW